MAYAVKMDAILLSPLAPAAPMVTDIRTAKTQCGVILTRLVTAAKMYLLVCAPAANTATANAVLSAILIAKNPYAVISVKNA
jgi:hypothetical protein